MGRGARAPRAHARVLRLVHAGDLGNRLRAADTASRSGARLPRGVPGLRRQARGELALVLHTHMPYVTGFGTWPFGEEWLWEATATSYLPLLDVLGRAPITLSLTPVLCDQLDAPGATERCLSFLEEIRPESHRLDIEGFRQAGQDQLGAELERC